MGLTVDLRMGTLIREKLWLGGLEDACSTEQLKKQGTTHILTIEIMPLREDRRRDFVYHFINAEGRFHDQSDAEWIVIRALPYGRPTPDQGGGCLQGYYSLLGTIIDNYFFRTLSA
jgi:hypothetical protein